MKKIDLKCENCGALMQVAEDKTEAVIHFSKVFKGILYSSAVLIVDLPLRQIAIHNFLLSSKVYLVFIKTHPFKLSTL